MWIKRRNNEFYLSHLIKVLLLKYQARKLDLNQNKVLSNQMVIAKVAGWIGLEPKLGKEVNIELRLKTKLLMNG